MRRRSQQQPFIVKAGLDGGQVAASGRGYDTLVSMPTMLESSALQVPSLVDEKERTKLSIKQKAAELSKKTRSSIRRKNYSGSVRNRQLLIPRERPKGQRAYGPKGSASEDKAVVDDNDGDDNDEG